MAAAGLLACNSALAAQPEADTAKVREAIERIAPDLEPDSITPSPLEGFFEVVVGAEVVYISADGRYLIQGDLFDLERDENLTEARRAEGRKALLATVDRSQMIVFEAPRPRHVVTVFTDIDCGYCRRLHRQIDDYNARGITIQYLFSPRSQASLAKAVTVWCSDDRKEAMSRAKAGESLAPKKCDNPVLEQARIARELGISGTPMLVLESGRVISGYLPPDQLAEVLEGQAKM